MRFPVSIADRSKGLVRRIAIDSFRVAETACLAGSAMLRALPLRPVIAQRMVLEMSCIAVPC